MFYALLFFLLSALFAGAGWAAWSDTLVGRVLAAGFGYAAAAELFAGLLYFSASVFRVNPGGLLKTREGRLKVWPRFLVWPYLIFEYRVWRQYRKRGREPLFEQVDEGLWLGSLPAPEDLPALREAGVDAVLDLVAEMADPPALRDRCRYLCVPTLDGCAPRDRELDAAVEFVRACRAEGRGVLVHCTFGHGRSASVMAASLVALGAAGDHAQALARLRALRRMIFLTREQKRMLERREAGPRG